MTVAAGVGTVRTSGEVGDYKLALMRDPCAYCGAPAELLDHIVPRSAGSTSVWENLAAACWRCNASKGPRTLLAYLAFCVHRARWEAVDRERHDWNRVGR